MGINLGRGGGVKSDINVTPLIDVVLVLLIIFLVTMPIVMRTITAEVPPECPDCLAQGSPLTLTVRADSSVTLLDGGKETTVPATDLARALRHAMEARTVDRSVFLDVEDPVRWGDVVTAMDTVRGVSGTVALKVRPSGEPDAAPGQAQ